MSESVVSFDVVTFHARGAWLLIDGEMTHSANGSATLASGEIVSFDCARYFNRAAPAGERTTYRVTLYSASRRELTASKWEALRGEIRRTFKGLVESMADGPRPAAIKPGTDSPATRARLASDAQAALCPDVPAAPADVPAEIRRRRHDMAGLALIAASLLGFVAMAWAAYAIDASRGISVSQSLAAWGL